MIGAISDVIKDVKYPSAAASVPSETMYTNRYFVIHPPINGEITVDIETLYEISQVLQVSISQLTTYLPETTSWKKTFCTSSTRWSFVISQ